MTDSSALLTPTDWNVIVLGYWNRAILTPEGIATRLYGIDPGAGITVEVPINGLEPYRVKFRGSVIQVSDRRIIVSAETPCVADLEQCKMIAAKALRDLPETPVTAAGINIRYDVTLPTQTEFENVVSLETEPLSDAGYEISSSTVKYELRSTKTDLPSGTVINLAFATNVEKLQIAINFHFSSQDHDWLAKCLDTDAQQFLTETDHLLKSVRLIGEPV